MQRTGPSEEEANGDGVGDERDARAQAESAVEQLLLAIGEDPSREGLLKTPERVAKALAFLNSGATRSARDVLSGAIFSESYRGLVLVQDIEFYSLCEHHMVPFAGKAHISYLPAGKVIGLSKLPRLLEPRLGVYTGRARTTRKGGTYPRREAILAPRPPRESAGGTS